MGEEPPSEEPRSPSRANDADAQNDAWASRRASLDGKVLVGGEGGDYIAETLSSAADVHAAIEHVRALGSLLDKDTEPVLGLLGALGVRRGEAYREMPTNGASLRAALAIFFGKANAAQYEMPIWRCNASEAHQSLV